MKREKRSLTTVALMAGLALCLGAPLAHAQPNTENATAAQRGSLSEKDYHFAEKAARANQMEVQLGQLAQQKAASASVRDFGQRMVTDHSKANDQLKEILAAKGATVPTRMSHHEHSTMQDMQNLSGTQFDQRYAKDMARDHKQDVKEFEKAIKDLQDPQLKAWAQQTLPILKEHLQQAQQIEQSLKSQK